MSPEQTIPSQRHLFDLPDDIAYLNCAYMAPLMHSVVEAGLHGVRRKARPWEIAAPDFFSGPAHARSLFARVVNARAEDAHRPARATGWRSAARHPADPAGQTIVLPRGQFPSTSYPGGPAGGRAEAGSHVDARTELKPPGAGRHRQGALWSRRPHCRPGHTSACSTSRSIGREHRARGRNRASPSI